MLLAVCSGSVQGSTVLRIRAVDVSPLLQEPLQAAEMSFGSTPVHSSVPNP